MDLSKTVLIIEDDPNIVDLVEIHLKDLGFDLDRASDGESGLEKALGNDYPLIILDLMLPKLDGFEVCRQIRSSKVETPILMLTSKSEEIDKVLGFELGADDYITKPFSVRELCARIKAALRRVERIKNGNDGKDSAGSLKFGELRVDLEKRAVLLGSKTVDLTAKEFDLLSLFARNPGRAYSRPELLDLVWGYQFSGYEHTVNSHINRLRSKIEKDPANPVFIKTVWGFGYRFAGKTEAGN